jgi:serine/threonine protein kinase/tetratricopeptide (TPR) repeat protein
MIDFELEPQGVDLQPGRSPSAATSDDPRVIAALEEYERLCEAGRPPRRAEFLQRHRQIAAVLSECLDGLEFLQRAGSSLMPAASADDPNEELPPATVLGDFRIIREIGRGGMGVVYEAEQLSLGRHVAFKVLPLADSLDSRQRQRFHIEAQAAALLQHEHIVPVIAVGCQRGVHFLAMRLINGWSLAEVIARLRNQEGLDLRPGSRSGTLDPGETATTESLHQCDSGQRTLAVRLSPAAGGERGGDHESGQAPKPAAEAILGALIGSTSLRSAEGARKLFRSVARLGHQAAEALAHAHGVGVIHRDIKPSNLLIDERLHLWITDFGLARIRDDPGPTRTGDFLGTLRYTSPEQLRGDRAVVDPRSDVYALGVTLYELLTLRPTFECDNRQELLHRILEDEPIVPRRINPSIPRDLETIVLKAMARETSNRYSTVSDLGADLKRFLDDLPIQARPPSLFERAAKWSRRHRTILATTAVLLAVSLIVGSGLLWQAKRRTDGALASLKVSKKQTDLALDSLRQTQLRGRLDFEALFVSMDRIIGQRLVKDRIGGPMPDEEGRTAYRNLIALYDETASRWSDTPAHAEVAAKALRRTGLYRMILRERQGDRDFQRAMELYRGIATKHPDWIWLRTDLIDTMRDYAGELAGFGRADEADSILREALVVAEGVLVEKNAELPCFSKGLVQQFNGLAWSLVQRPSRRPDDPARAARLVEWAIGHEPARGPFMTTLAMARYRACEWAPARAAAEESLRLQDGAYAPTQLLLAMVLHRQGASAEARRQYEQARHWLEENLSPPDPVVERIRDEAEGLLSISGPQPRALQAGNAP